MKTLKFSFILILFLSFMSAGCNRSDKLDKIPQYPGATEDQEHDAKIAGMSLGKVKRMLTSDSYDKVFAFYQEQLTSYNPEVKTYALEDGRQTAITIVENDKGSITVVIQEFKEEEMVAISFMKVGR